MVDWLTAVRGEAITLELCNYEEKLQKRACAPARDEKSAESLVETLETTMAGRQQSAVRLHQQGEAAAAKLAYLLGSDHGVPVPGTAVLTPVDLVGRQSAGDMPWSVSPWKMAPASATWPACKRRWKRPSTGWGLSRRPAT